MTEPSGRGSVLFDGWSESTMLSLGADLWHTNQGWKALWWSRCTGVDVNRRQVGNSAKARGMLAETDAADARVLAISGEAAKPAVRPFQAEMRANRTVGVTTTELTSRVSK